MLNYKLKDDINCVQFGFICIYYKRHDLSVLRMFSLIFFFLIDRNPEPQKTVEIKQEAPDRLQSVRNKDVTMGGVAKVKISLSLPSSSLIILFILFW